MNKMEAINPNEHDFENFKKIINMNVKNLVC